MADVGNIFERFLYEAPDDDPPDVVSDTGPPPDVPDNAGTDDGPPDMGDFGGDAGSPDTGGDAGMDDAPPDMGGDDFGDGDDGGFDGLDDNGDSGTEEDPQNLELDEKISNVMNKNLYNDYLRLITKVNTQLTSIRDNSDILYTLSEDTLEAVKNLELLDENLRIYIDDKFLNENYSKNKLFYNKCLNLLGLINMAFDKCIHKGIKEQK